jgi:hypothetical protein
VLLTNQLADALVKYSDKRLSSDIAEKVANIALKNVDFSNSTLAHKGINWFAKDLLKRIKY